MNRPTRYPDLETHVCAVRNAIVLAEQTFDAMELGNGDEVNLTSYALSQARQAAHQLRDAFYEAFEAERDARRAVLKEAA